MFDAPVRPTLLYRIAAICGFVAAFCVVGYGVPHPATGQADAVTSVRWDIIHALGFIAALLAIVSLLAFHVRHLAVLGLGGLLGMALAVAGWGMFAGETFGSAFYTPLLTELPDKHYLAVVGGTAEGFRGSMRFLTDGLLGTGLFVLGLQAWRRLPARIHRQGGLLLMVGGVGFSWLYRYTDFGNDLSSLLLAVALGTLAYAQLREIRPDGDGDSAAAA